MNVDDACRLLADTVRDLALWHGRAEDLEAERDSYRLLAQQTIHALHDLQARQRIQSERYQQLLEDMRSLRTQLNAGQRRAA